MLLAMAIIACGTHKAPAPTPLAVTPRSELSGPDATATAHFTVPFVEFGFRIVLAGPVSARTSEDITYTLEYQRVQPDPKGSDTGFVIAYNLVNFAQPPQPAASLQSVRAVVGEPPINVAPMNPGLSEKIELVGDAGKLEIVVHPTPAFAGPLTIKAYVRGTSIEFPSGSVSEEREQS